MQSIVDKVQIALVKKRTCCICEKSEARYAVKGLEKDCYCKECASELFSDLGLLERI